MGKDGKKMRLTRILSALVVVMVLLLDLSPGRAAKALPPVGTVTLELTGVGALVGVSWGHGVLWFKGKKYPFHIEGMSVGDVGVAKVSARGKVFNLKHPYDLSGTYGALGAGVALAGGVAGPGHEKRTGGDHRPLRHPGGGQTEPRPPGPDH